MCCSVSSNRAFAAVQEQRRKSHGSAFNQPEEENNKQRFRLLIDRLIAAEKELTEDAKQVPSPESPGSESAPHAFSLLIEDALRDTVEWAMKIPSFVDLPDDVKTALLTSGTLR